jgi:ABC-2 type transport system permease protein
MHQGAIQGCGSITELRSLLGLQERYFLQVAGIHPAAWRALQTELPTGTLISASAELEKPVMAATAQVEVVSSDEDSRLDRAIDAIRAQGGIIQAVWRDQASLETIFNTLTAPEKRSIPGLAVDTGDDHSGAVLEANDLILKPGSASSRLNFLFLNLWRIPKAFLKRDFLDESSYRFSFLIQFISIFMSAGMFFFIAKLVDQASISSLSVLDGGYFPFALIGLAFSAYFSTGLTSFSSSLRQAQTTGTLEAMLTSPTQVSTIIISSSLWSYVMTTFRAALYLLVGIVLGMDISHANLLSAVVILALTIAAFNGIGILAASFIMVLKRGDPINWLINSLSSLLGGVYYPVQLLPAWLQPISKLIPLTYSLDALRKALLEGAPLTDLGVEILALLAFSCLLLPVSLAAFRFALRRARTDGSLTHY